jgi:phosphogluconate dehydratase
MLLVDDAELAQRIPLIPDLTANQFGNGRELFSIFRDNVGPVEDGANSLI